MRTGKRPIDLVDVDSGAYAEGAAHRDGRGHKADCPYKAAEMRDWINWQAGFARRVPP